MSHLISCINRCVALVHQRTITLTLSKSTVLLSVLKCSVSPTPPQLIYLQVNWPTAINYPTPVKLKFSLLLQLRIRFSFKNPTPGPAVDSFRSPLRLRYHLWFNACFFTLLLTKDLYI